MIRKKNKHVNHKLFQDLILKYLVPSGFHIDEQFWLSGYLVNTINTDSIVQFTLKELPQIYFGAYIDPTITINQERYDKIEKGFISIFLDENLLEKAYLNDPNLIGLVNPVLHTKLKSLSSLNHTQRITYINELYDEHWSDKHTTVIY